MITVYDRENKDISFSLDFNVFIENPPEDLLLEHCLKAIEEANFKGYKDPYIPGMDEWIEEKNLHHLVEQFKQTGKIVKKKILPTKITKKDLIRKELYEIKKNHETEAFGHDPYWRGVRIGLETALNILEEE